MGYEPNHLFYYHHPNPPLTFSIIINHHPSIHPAAAIQTAQSMSNMHECEMLLTQRDVRSFFRSPKLFNTLTSTRRCTAMVMVCLQRFLGSSQDWMFLHWPTAPLLSIATMRISLAPQLELMVLVASSPIWIVSNY